ncbi:hypothetical protein LXL04_036275 [Taraxacum kok-saghyz]
MHQHPPLRSSLPEFLQRVRGFEVIRSLVAGTTYPNVERSAREAIDASIELEPVTSTVFDDNPDKYIWERGCILHCELPIKLPVFYSSKDPQGFISDAEDMLTRATEAVATKFRNPKTTCVLETVNGSMTESPQPVIIKNSDLENSNANPLLCSHFCYEDWKHKSPSVENADKIQVSFFLSTSVPSVKPTAPFAENIPGESKHLVVHYKLKVICYATKDLLLKDAILNLIIPGLIDQLHTMKNMTLPNLLSQHPKLHPYHFSPPGFLHPITAIYDLIYGETEMKQVEIRRALHMRLGLPLDRPLLRIASPIDFLTSKEGARWRRIAIGYDEGTIMVKVGREEPVASIDNSEKIIWAKHNEIQTVNIFV